MKISIALCTYNGASFLAEQLNSIAAQTLPAQEIILCDDGSADDSIKIAQTFVASGMPLHIKKNPRRLGFSANFEKAIHLCSGDIIFLCDQDDIWQKDKIATTVAHFQKKPDTILAFSNGVLVDQNTTPLGSTLWSALSMPPLQQPKFHDLLNNDWVTGASCAFRVQLRELALPIPPGWIHDSWLGIIAAATGNVTTIPETLFAYRQHTHNQIGLKRPSLQVKLSKIKTLLTTPHTETAVKYFPLRDRLPPNHQAQIEIAEKIQHLQNRQPLSGKLLSKIVGILKEILNGRYFRYANGFKSIIRDIILLGSQINSDTASPSEPK